ncbi:DM13 domain-containing protein [Candidiatus Paracoxiella cheracis]|uniref:DM13 domain-containing protein n=1 Tax=Candidiatus Paracoxiella cheracis TaxID=3405120 RepID=UPI003BF614F6
MKKTWLISFVTLVIGFIIGVALTVIFYPFLFPPPQVNEQIVNMASKMIVAKGSFIGFDRVHYGKGNVTIYKDGSKYEVFLNKNFEVGPGPAFHIYLSESANITTKRAFQTAKNYDLGMLKSFSGSQVYQVPSDIDFSKIKSVVVWCVSFRQLISSANLKQQ